VLLAVTEPPSCILPRLLLQRNKAPKLAFLLHTFLLSHIDIIYIYITVLSVCARVPLCPQISESASPMALEFGHNVAGEYARV
jgi:hypothetical protein